jgi:DNA-binding Lrp family transcriptional regulator
MKLDRIDLGILRALQVDGRLSAQALSERVSLSPRACLDRIRRLESGGYIVGYRALLDRTKLGAGVAVFAQITLTDQRSTTRRSFERRIERCDEVVGCWLVSGEFDYLVRMVCPNLDVYHQITNAWIDDLSMSVARVVSNAELETVKSAGEVPANVLAEDPPAARSDASTGPG